MKKTLKFIWNMLAAIAVTFLILSASFPSWTAKIYPFSMRIVGNLNVDSTLHIGDTMRWNESDTFIYLKSGVSHRIMDAAVGGIGPYFTGTSDIRWDNRIHRLIFNSKGGTSRMYIDSVGVKVLDTMLYVADPLKDSTVYILGVDNDTVYKIPYYGRSGGGITINNNTNNNLLTASGSANTVNGESEFVYSGGSGSITSETAANFGLNYYTTTPGNYSQLILGKYNGTIGSYGALDDNDYLGSVNFAGSESSSVLQTAANISVVATENWSTSANGNEMIFETTHTGASSSMENMTIGDSTVTINAMLKLQGLNTAPASPSVGMIYYNKITDHLYVYLSTGWTQLDN